MSRSSLLSWSASCFSSGLVFVKADLELAERAARAAGEVLMSYYGRPPEGLDAKSSDTDLVSDADREAERVVRELLEAERPGDGLLAEEGSHAEAESGRRWVVDPLDGTINFLYGFPAWAVSIALEDGRRRAGPSWCTTRSRPELFSAVGAGGAHTQRGADPGYGPDGAPAVGWRLRASPTRRSAAPARPNCC